MRLSFWINLFRFYDDDEKKERKQMANSSEIIRFQKINAIGMFYNEHQIGDTFLHLIMNSGQN